MFTENYNSGVNLVIEGRQELSEVLDDSNSIGRLMNLCSFITKSNIIEKVMYGDVVNGQWNPLDMRTGLEWMQSS